MDHDSRDIDHLISRHLDGELSEGEELLLNRELIRDPDARRRLEEYERIDAMAAEALDRAVPGRESSFDMGTLVTDRRPRRKARYHRGWWLVPGAVAAALLAVMVNRATLPGVGDQHAAGPAYEQPASVPVVTPGPTAPNDLMRNVVADPVPRRQIKRDITRDYLGIVGEDGRIYWIEVDRTRTINLPNAASTYRPVSKEL
jgi:hypothetical protein